MSFANTNMDLSGFSTPPASPTKRGSIPDRLDHAKMELDLTLDETSEKARRESILIVHQLAKKLADNGSKGENALMHSLLPFIVPEVKDTFLKKDKQLNKKRKKVGKINDLNYKATFAPARKKVGKINDLEHKDTLAPPRKKRRISFQQQHETTQQQIATFFAQNPIADIDLEGEGMDLGV